MKSAIVVFSGGPDSTAAALWGISEGFSIKLLTFQFKGDEQNGELLSAMQVAKVLSLPHSIVDFKAPMALFKSDVHVLMHADTSQSADKAKPHRMEFGAGMILSTAAAYAVYHGYDCLIWGANKDDLVGGRFEYSQEFANGIAELVSKCVGKKFDIHVPFATQHKYQVFKAFLSKEDLFAHTWSSKSCGPLQDGATRSCVARRLAAELAGLKDNTKYVHQNFKNPLSKEQMMDFAKLSDDDFAQIFGSETVPGTGG